MKLAEALANRKALQDRVAALTNRARKSVLAVEGRTATESAERLMADIAMALEQWEKRVVEINQANMEIQLDNGMTVMEALARRDRLTRHVGVLNELMQVVLGPGNERYAMMPREAAQMIPTVDISQLQAVIDQLTDERRDLDLAIQEAGWTHEIKS